MKHYELGIPLLSALSHHALLLIAAAHFNTTIEFSCDLIFHQISGEFTANLILKGMRHFCMRLKLDRYTQSLLSMNLEITRVEAEISQNLNVLVKSTDIMKEFILKAMSSFQQVSRQSFMHTPL